MGDDASLEDFIMKWSLQPESQALLQGLDAALQHKVVNQIAPRDTSRDCNAIFCKFVHGLSTSTPMASSKGKGKGARAPYPYNAAPQGLGAIGGMVTGDLAGFVAQWRLNADAQNILMQMVPEAQQKVMSQFAPRDTSTDVSNIFMKFAQNVARGTGHGAQRFRRISA